MHPQFIVTGAASLVAAVTYGLVAFQIGRRSFDKDLRAVGIALGASWAAFAFEALTDAGRVAAMLLPEPDTILYFTLARAKILAAGLAIWGFGFYVSYLWSGDRRWSYAFGALGLSHAGLFLYLFEQRQPSGVTLGTWAPRMEFAQESVLAPAFGPIVLVWFFVPPILLAALYLGLMRRLSSRTQRFRIFSVAMAIIVYHGVGIVQFNPNTSSDTPAFLVAVLLTILAGAFAYLSYMPPAWLKRRLGLRDLDEERASNQRIQPAERGAQRG